MNAAVEDWLMDMLWDHIKKVDDLKLMRLSATVESECGSRLIRVGKRREAKGYYQRSFALHLLWKQWMGILKPREAKKGGKS